MTNKTLFYARMAEEAAKQVTASREKWTGFLTTAARLYKYPFAEQLMIYTQRPDATACAEYDLWNDTMNRYVKRGSKGIALVDNSGDEPRLRYVFDVSDTGERRNSRPVRLWEMKTEHEEPVRLALIEAFSLGDERLPMLEAITESARVLAKEYWEDHKNQILDIVADSYLEGYDEFNTGASFRSAAATSIAYCVMSRTIGDADRFFEPEDFLDIFDFNTQAAVNVLGCAVSDMSSQVFREIERTIRSVDRAIEAERSQNHDEHHLHEGRGLSAAGDSAGTDREQTPGQVRQDAQSVSSGEQQPALQSPDPDREAVPSPVGDSGDRDSADGAADAGALEAEPGTGQGEESAGLGSAYERTEGAGGGAGGGGAYNQLTLFGLFPTEAEQIEKIDSRAQRQTLAESEMPSAFSISESELENVLRGGSGFANGKMRIYAMYRQQGDAKERAEFLKNEYGIGGRSYTFEDGTRGFVDYNSKGILVRSYEHDRQVNLRWPEVDKRLDRMIEEGRYLTEQEMAAAMELEAESGGELPTPKPAFSYPPVRSAPEPEDNPFAGMSDEEIDELPISVEIDGEVQTFPNAEAAEEAIAETEAVFHAEENGLPYDIVIEKLRFDEPEVELPEIADEESVTEPEPVQVIPAQNFHITDDHLGEGGAKQKFRANIMAIQLLKKLEDEDRNATPEEQETLSRYVGWGGLADAFDENKPGWTTEYHELIAVLTPEEYAAARASTLNAHFTSPTVIKAIYEAVENMGFTGGNILEPSMGVGNFFGLLPEGMQNSRLYGVELDSITGRIAQKLYPKAEITVAGFETTDRRDFYDLAVGNVPFGNYKVSDKPYDKLGFSIHNYFFAKALDQVRPGGVVAFVTSRYTMDSKNPDARQYVAQRAELLGAIRLPNNAFRANAGTDVVSDVLLLQKRDHPIDISPDWVHLGQTADGLAMNSYFIEHPEMVLGKIATESTQYGKQDLTVEPIPGAELSVLLHDAISNINGQYEAPELTEPDDLTMAHDTIPADPRVKNFSYTVVDGEIYFRENSIMRHVELSDTATGRVKGMVELRRIVVELMDYQLEDYPDEDIKAKQNELNVSYDRFTAEYGLINSRANAQAFSEDSSYYLLCSLENIDENGKLKSKADMFTRRTIRPERVITSVDTPAEALAVSIGEHGGVDLPYMAQLLGTPGEYNNIITELRGIIFRDPYEAVREDITVGWHTADDYLSGNVRAKLAAVRMAAGNDSEYQVNVDALIKAQPKELDASEIDVRLGATWLDRNYIQQFMEDTFEPPYYMRRSIEVKFSPMTAEWQITGKSNPSRNDVHAYMTYGTSRANAYRILEDTLNLRDIRIYDTIEDMDGKQKRVLNKKETTLAQQKQQAIKDAFQAWIWKDPRRRQRLVEQYNELFNSTRPREYDGSHIRFGGMNPEIKLREHQLNAIAHVLYGGNTLLAHEVGAGKTYEMAASAMEAKRLGLCQKSLFVVPNHLTLQWANEFLHLYPSAKLLVASKKDFETANRKKFCARIATGDYDAVIIGHSQFEKIPISAERQERMIRDQIDEIEDALSELKYSRGESFSIKQMEKTRKSLQARLDKLQANDRKDDVITFEQLGVDRLFVDEAHAFKNLFLYTKMRNVAGLSTSEAQKSSDMFMKCQYMDELTGGRGVVFATGTPVSNSMTELYTMMRYLQYGTLQQKGLTHFDCWASTFGETTTAIELAPEGTGYRARTRFAKFFNLPELMSMFKEVADIKTSDQLHLPVPEAKFETVVVQPSEHQKNMVKDLSDRAAKVHSGMVDPSVDNMLKITSDGRKLGLDQRLMNPLLPDDPDSKLNACVRNVLKIYEDGKPEKLTQLLFCDLSTPKNDGSFNVYEDIKTKLILSGVPEKEIAFIHDADTEAKKKELFSKVRSGQVRVLLGSTQKMGAGTNVQDRLVAVHHLDVGWRPSDMTQRNGRIIRQGNRNKEVQVYQYVTEGTFDAYLYQTLENKQKFISQIMTSKSPVRSCDDVDEQALSYAEIKALCAGNPLIREKMDLDVDVARLKVLRADHLSQQYRLEDKLLKYFPAEIEKTKGFIAGFESDIRTAESHPQVKDGFCGMEVRGKLYDEKNDAGEAVLACCKAYQGMESVPLGSYRGFKTELTFDSFTREFQVLLRGEMTHRVNLGTSAIGIITRLDNALAGIPERKEKSGQQLDNLYAQRDAAQAEVGKPFPQEAELNEKSERLAQLNAELNMDERGGEDLSLGGDDLEDALSRHSVLADLKEKAGSIPPPKHTDEEVELY